MRPSMITQYYLCQYQIEHLANINQIEKLIFTFIAATTFKKQKPSAGKKVAGGKKMRQNQKRTKQNIEASKVTKCCNLKLGLGWNCRKCNESTN